MNKPSRVRFAPSPTGHLHLGGARTALYDYLLAHQTEGRFILRIEDTDRKRLVPGAEEELMAGLRWLGLEWDEGPDVGGPYGPYRQSERREIYQQYAHQLVASGNAYYCFCTPEHLQQVRQQQQQRKEQPRYDGACRKLDPDEAAHRVARGETHVIRFKTPTEGTTTVHDLLRGDITVNNQQLDDYILVKSDGLALYHLAAMVDDHLMKITHVIRGSEWLPTFPLHGMICRSLGWDEPAWVHLSVFLKPSGKGKMSKRESAELMKDGHSIFVKDLKGLGYLPEAAVNWISLMGWSYDDHSEFFSLPDLVEKFSLEKLNPSPAAINFSKFDHFNGLHIRNLPIDELAKRMEPFFINRGFPADHSLLVKVAPIIQERMVTLDEGPELVDFLFQENIQPVAEELVAKNTTARQSASAARRMLAILASVPDLHPQTTEPPLRALVDELNLKPGQLFGILRVAVTGKSVSPPLMEIMEIIGKEKIIQRIQNAITILDSMADK